jgi:DNA (cytosine-5)-methyltransferase 1
MAQQINIFEGHIPYYKITKPVRLIELFAGIGSQHQALKNLGVKIDRTTIVEWQVNSIQAYNDMHVRKYTDYTTSMTKEEIAFRLNQLGVSIDYNEPVRLETLMRKSEEWLRNVYNNIINTNNKVNIMSVKGSHLNIVDTDKYDYIMTYSFPCQDLSKAGKGKGMSDTSTRSGLLWEVERILTELEHKPQVLLMENVPDVIGTRYISDFRIWEERLRELGYSNHIEILNSKDYGIPQNRQRAFMVSILGDYLYEFAQKQQLTLQLKDMLEQNVDEKYYLSDNILSVFSAEGTGKYPRKERFIQNLTRENEDIANAITTLSGSRPTDNFVGDTKEFANYITWKDDKGRLNTQDHRAYFEDRLSGTVPAMERGVPNVLLSESIVIPEDTTQGYALAHEGDVVVKETIIYDDYNSTIRKDQDTIGTITTMIGRDSERHGFKLIEKTIKASSNDVGVVVKEENRFFEQAFKTLRENEVKEGDTINAFNEQVDTSGLSPTLTTRPEGFKTAILPVVNNLRIRKLTPKECYRLMGFSDQAFDLAQPNQSNSSLYHQAGDSIVVNVLMAIFKELL